MILKGDKCPNFIGKDENGEEISSSSLLGKNFVLYFYPKNDTPGCTIEANEFNNLLLEFEKLNCTVVGISKDSPKSHNKFKEKYCLKFPLITDESTEICNTFGVMKEKSMFGKKYLGISRDTFLVDKNGNIVKIWNNVTASGHANDVLTALKSL
jgi:thioredoxin-dependent peroxiredoxin